MPEAGQGCWEVVEEGWGHELEAEPVSAASRRDQLVNAASVSYHWRWGDGCGTQGAQGAEEACLPLVSTARVHK